MGFWVRVTRERWLLITTAKHPAMAGREAIVKPPWRIQSRVVKVDLMSTFCCSTMPRG